MTGWLRSFLNRKKVDNQPGSPQPAPTGHDMNPIHVTDDTFRQQVLENGMPVLVDFWAPWCGPCRMIAPILEDLARAYDGRAIIAKVNTDDHAQYARQLDIRGIPTLIYFRDGQEVDRVVGFAPRHVLEAKLKAILR